LQTATLHTNFAQMPLKLARRLTPHEENFFGPPYPLFKRTHAFRTRQSQDQKYDPRTEKGRRGFNIIEASKDKLGRPTNRN